MDTLSIRELIAGLISARFSRTTQLQPATSPDSQAPDPNLVYEASVFADNRELRFMLHDDNHPLVNGWEVLRIRDTIEEIRKDKKLGEFLQRIAC